MALLAPDNRALLLDSLRPPPGHTLDRAVATTFTLDLETALTVPLAFAGFQFDEQSDPIEIMEALRQMGGRIDVFCQAGAISARTSHSDLFALLEDVIHEVKRPQPGHIFHPKLWVLRFDDGSQEPSFRLIVLSRNLTSARNWDTLLWLDGRKQGRSFVSNEPLARFVATLPELTVNQMPAARRDELLVLSEELKQVRWDLPAGVREARFHPIGLPGAMPFPVEEHFRGYRKLVISPFVRDSALRRLLRPRKGQKAVLVSRGEEIATLQQDTINRLDVFELDPAASLQGDELGEEDSHSLLTNLHAKVFVVERARLAHLFVGSANATGSGFGANVEFICELIGSVSNLGVDALVGEDAPFRAILTPYVAPEIGVDTDEVDTAGRHLDDLLFDIAGDVRFRTTATESVDGWVPRITADTELPPIPEGTRLTISAHNRPSEEFPLSSFESIDIELTSRALGDVTPFLRLTARQTVNGTSIERSAVICSILDGAPGDRFDEILARQIDTPEKFMKFLALLIGLAWGIGGDTSSTGNGSGTWTAGSGQGVLELLARALSERPEAIDHLAPIVERLRRPSNGNIILPPGWDDVWLPALEARKAIYEEES